ncbi:MAG: hypothetical protein HKM89_01610 [Gemmatimonadales bacterium]|nr:hypothetical protein [Gemmatimonadales bacterium]
MWFLVTLVATIAFGLVGFNLAKSYVKRRLRFVDAVYSPLAPVIAAVIGGLLAWPLAILPVITTGMAAIFGIGSGLGTASAVKALKRGEA